MQIIVNNILTNYEVLKNDQSDEFLLILPGWMRTAQEWQNITPMVQSHYNIVALDFPGFGKSQQPAEDFDTYDYTNFVKSFLEKLNIKNCTVLGHSFGGRIAIILAATTDIVDKLILVDSAGINKKKTGVTVKKVLATFLKKFSKLLPKKTQAKLRNRLGSNDYQTAGEMRKTFVKIINQDLSHHLSQIKVPALVIWGEKDDQLEYSQTKIFKKAIPEAIVRIVWGAGHSPHLEKPEAFNDILEEYLC